MLIHLCEAIEVTKMLNTTDLYLGTFLILCGFALSLFNLRRVVKGGTKFSHVLLSENVILMCIGIAFVSRSVYSLNPSNVKVFDMEERAAEFDGIATRENMSCGFHTVLLGYGPLVVSMVNSFLSLIIDNYLHYRVLQSLKKTNDDNVVREMSEDNSSERKFRTGFCSNFKKYFSILTIAVQWIVPTLTALAMYLIDVKEISMPQARLIDESCMAILELVHNECTDTANYTMDLLKYVQSPVNFFESQETVRNDTQEIDTVLSNVLRIMNNFNNHTNFNYASIKSLRQPKTDEHCMTMCYMDNKSLLSYMFIFGFVSYVLPITISAIILTRIHVMEVTKPKTKLYVTRELLCNVLFWTPVMFDTFLSLILCSYSMHGVRTSMFNVVANIYQAVKNFMNTKFFKENSVIPV